MKNLSPIVPGRLSFLPGRSWLWRRCCVFSRLDLVRLPHVVHFNYDRRQAAR